MGKSYREGTGVFTYLKREWQAGISHFKIYIIIMYRV
jgi:hypothetical protein